MSERGAERVELAAQQPQGQVLPEVQQAFWLLQQRCSKGGAIWFLLHQAYRILYTTKMQRQDQPIVIAV